MFPINKLQTSIGRNLDNDLVIQNPQVSRVHAEIRFMDGAFVIIDLDSTTGTYVNNVKVKQGKIYSGDVILIGNTPLMFLDDKDSAYEDLEKKTDKMKKKRKE